MSETATSDHPVVTSRVAWITDVLRSVDCWPDVAPPTESLSAGLLDDHDFEAAWEKFVSEDLPAAT